uniref:Uncharacterized protein n=1 Tax=Geospiza parvula TaxID=87175 RepID=A0A8C3NHV8_GEOPR
MDADPGVAVSRPCRGVAAMAGLLPALVAVSQKAAEVARRCRAEEPLFRLLVAEKSGPERSARFERDFKTLADVLIQELIKHDLGTQFPELRGHIHGEESSEFRDAHGGTVTVRVGATPEDTVALLVAVLGPEHTRAAELLAEAVHQEVTLGDTELDGIDPGLSPGELGIWIDPIDSTNEFIGGREDVAAVDGVAPGGLRSALVLVGAFDRRSGVPVLGVINEPFFQRDPQSHRWQGRYHWGVAHGATRLCSLSPPVPRARPRVVLSRAESAAVRGALASLGGPRFSRPGPATNCSAWRWGWRTPSCSRRPPPSPGTRAPRTPCSGPWAGASWPWRGRCGRGAAPGTPPSCATTGPERAGAAPSAGRTERGSWRSCIRRCCGRCWG